MREERGSHILKIRTGGRPTPLIMVVDDEDVMRLVLSELLESEGYQVISASNGAEAVIQYEAHRPDLILLDLMMPVMDGLETCTAIRREAEGDPVPIVVLTAEQSDAIMERAFEAGATDYFTKPANNLLLIQKIRRLLHSRNTELALQDSHNKLSHSQRLAGMGYWEYDTRSATFAFSPELKHLFGIEKGVEITSLLSFFSLIHRADRRMVAVAIRQAIDKRSRFDLEHRMIDRDGVEYIVQHHGEAICSRGDDSCRVVGTIIDITERRDAQSLIEDQIFFDKLTGLPNRLLFTDKLAQFMSTADERQELLALLFVGIDRFKNINDSLGHTFGDRLLQAIADRLGGVDDHVGLVARFSGDIFSVVIEKVQSLDQIEVIITKLQTAFTAPFEINGEEFYLTVSIGCAIHPLSDDNREQLIKSADAAMFQAKSAGGNRYHVYSADIDTKVSRRLSLETSLRKALEREEFTLFYQPQVAVHNNRIIGMEALIRWERPEIGLVPPDVFIPIAEETGLIVPIGSWVMESAARQAAAWNAQIDGMLRVGINLSAKQFEGHGLLKEIEQVISNTGIEPCCLDMEITETSAMRDLNQTIRTLNQLREMGIQSSMDDFGTGYSSLHSLHKMPLHTLKIDRAFIMNITDDGKNSDLARIIILMCQALGLNVIAEGVETQGQMNFLLEHNCSEAQGYYISRPVPANEFEQLLQDMNRPENNVSATTTLF